MDGSDDSDIMIDDEDEEVLLATIMPTAYNERLEDSILCCCRQHELHNELMKFNLKLQPKIDINA